MADDSMEMGSDHGRIPGPTDDYDVDIDLTTDATTGHADDEDFMLDDVISNAEPGEHHMRDQSPLVGADDIMLDEEAPDEAYDEELLDGEQHLEHMIENEEPSHSFVHLNEQYTEYSESTKVPGDDVSERANSTWDHDQSLDLETFETDVQFHDTHEAQHNAADDTNTFSGKNENEHEEPLKTASSHESRTASPQQVSQEHLAAEGVGSPFTSNQGHLTASPHDSLDPANTDQIHHDEELNEEDSNEEEWNEEVSNEEELNEQIEEGDNARVDIIQDGLPHITVIYRDTEYDLFGAPDSVNTDSFFLSDLSIVDKPISAFFEGIRNVIHDDLLEEEELCIVIDSYGLEVQEISCSLHDVTISQILELHENLLLNDEIVAQRPLCIYLFTKTSFAKRLATLVTGAAEGKCLSDMVAQPENSKHPYMAEEGTDDIEDHGPSSEEEFADAEALDNQVDAHLDDAVPGNGEIHYSVEQTSVGEHQDYDHLETGEGLYDDVYQESQEGEDGSAPTELAPEVEQAASTTHGEYISTDGLDEDGDLIDYSDEEQEATTVPVDNGRSRTAEYEAINEDLRRRSLSRAAETRQENQATPTDPQVVYTEETYTEVEVETADVTGNPEEWNHAEGEEYEYNDDAQPDVDPVDGLDNNDYLDLSVGGVEQVATELTDTDSVAGLDGILAVGDEAEQVSAENGEQANKLEDEFDYNFDDEEEDHTLLEVREPGSAEPVPYETNGGQETSNTGVAQPQVGQDAISSATASVNSAHPEEESAVDEFDIDLTVPAEGEKPAVGAEVQDEIDYDDDDYAPDLATSVKSENPTPPATINGGAGKRSWDDLELDEGAIATNNDAKRICS